MKTVFQLARKANRNYITPEDVGDAIRSGCDLARTRNHVLRVLAGLTKFGAEDGECCAFVALTKRKNRNP